jgi:hypothetical protein
MEALNEPILFGLPSRRQLLDDVIFAQERTEFSPCEYTVLIRVYHLHNLALRFQL